jgi:hypothetical protein
VGGGGDGASVAVGWHGVAGSGPVAVLTGGACAGGARPVAPHYSPGQRRFEYTSNSNEFKLLQNLPNMTDPKIVFPSPNILK